MLTAGCPLPAHWCLSQLFTVTRGIVVCPQQFEARDPLNAQSEL